MKKIGIFKRSCMAWAPDELVRCINKYSDVFEATLLNPELGNFGAETKDDIPVLKEYNFDDFDLIHFNNKYFSTNKPKIIQYHSPYDPSIITVNFPGTKTVVAQYHATLPGYQGCLLVRNVIDHNIEDYSSYYANTKIKIGYSPSVKISGFAAHESKGWNETCAVLNNLKSRCDADIDIIVDVDIKECIRRKRLCDVIIDECVTGSYHRSGLEGLALGKMTICSLSPAVINILNRASKTNIVPFENIGISQLENFLYDLVVNQGIEKVHNKGRSCRLWFDTYWSPEDIVKEFETIYLNEIGG